MKSIKKLVDISNRVNIAKDIDDDRLGKIAALCLDSYETDLSTSQERYDKIDEFISMARLDKEEKTWPWPGAANAKYPLMTVAAMQFNARAFPALVPSGKIVNARVFGQDLTGEKSDRGERISNHMSYQLRYGMDTWIEDMDSLFLRVPIVGHIFKKSYYDPVTQKPCSSLLMPNQLVVNNDETKELDSCPVVTEVLQRTPQQIKTNINAGVWLDVDIKFEDEDNEKLETILEQHRLLDIYEDGNKEPYIVTIHKGSGNILRIKACFDKDTILVDLDGEYRKLGEIEREIESDNIAIRRRNLEANLLDAKARGTLQGERTPKVVEIPEKKPFNYAKHKAICVDKIKYYTDYWYLPSFDGKFYKAGLADLLLAISNLVDTNLNQMLDAGTLANLQGGFKARTAKFNSKIFNMTPGEFKDVDTGGLPIRDVLMPMDFKGPNPVLFNLLGMLIDAGRDISSVKDIMVGEAPQGETATTTMIKREEGMRVFSAIYSRLYRSLTREFKCLFKLNRKYLKQEEYFRFGDNESFIAQEDYEDDKLDIIPVADPKESSSSDRILKAQTLMQFVSDPDANPQEIKKNFMGAIGLDPSEYEKYFPGAQPAPPPPEFNKIMAETNKIVAETEKIREDKLLVRTKAIEALANAESKEAGSQLAMYKQALEEIVASEEIKRGREEGMANATNNQMGDEGADTGPIEGGGEESIPQPPEEG